MSDTTVVFLVIAFTLEWLVCNRFRSYENAEGSEWCVSKQMS
jgi:hypothetical protein